MRELKHIEAFVMDADGTLIEGGKPLKGAIDFIDHLNTENIPYIILTNNSTKTVATLIDKLTMMGFKLQPTSILTAADIVARVLKSEARQVDRCLVIGEHGIAHALHAAGFEVVKSGFNQIDYVVIGMDRQLTYDKLKDATLAIRNGARFFSSNADPVFLDVNRAIPASGAIQAALEYTTGKKARVTGKPQTISFKMAMKMMGSTPIHTAMLGDQLEVDIRGAKGVGMKAFLVLSSLTPRFSKVGTSTVPDGVYKNMMDFYRQWIAR
jgi:4-nitrophenyl phosphatase